MLPPLIFGNNRSSIETDLNRFRDSIDQFCDTVTSMESTVAAKDFRQKNCHLNINDIALTTTASTPLELRTEDTNALVISVAFNSSANTLVNGKTYQWHSGSNAFFSAGEKRSGSAGLIGLLNIRPNADRLKNTASTMLGGSSAFEKALNWSRPIELNSHCNNFDRMIRHSCAAMDSLNLCENTLGKLGFDDVIYRMTVMMLAPELFVSNTNHSGATAGEIRLNRVCEYVMANLFSTITLTDLESVAALSARTLQYSFLKAYGCSPMTWVRRQRLLKARERLLLAQPGTGVTTIALECGFNKLSTFSSYYLRFFKELPSETLQQAKSLAPGEVRSSVSNR